MAIRAHLEMTGITHHPTGSTATLKLSSALKPGRSYTASLSNAVTDLAGNRLAALSWTFTTALATTSVGTSSTDQPDVTAPRLTSKPPPGASGVARNTAVIVTFSEPVKGVSKTTFMLRDKAIGARVPAAVSYDVASRTAAMTPGRRLGALRSYAAVLSNDIRDRAGNRLPATSWVFTTALE